MARALSNEEFGQRIGMSAPAASRIRTGKQRPSLKVLARISAEFRIPINDLLLACVESGPGQAEIIGIAVPRLADPPEASP